jgi:CheY-like chemotaxis protein
MAKKYDCPTVMLVNDSDEHDLVMELELNGYHVLEAANAWEAVEKAEDYTRRERPDIILIDLNQPQDGFSAVCLMRDGAELGRVPIVLLSTRQEAGYYTEAIAAGCSECIAKPVEFARLKNLLDRLLSNFSEELKANARSTVM